MPRKGKGRKYDPNFTSCRVSGNLDLSTLATVTLLGADLVPAADEAYRAISLDVAVAADAIVGGDGPVAVGIAHGDYTNAEIEEWIEATTSISRGDQLVLEKARRKCRLIGELTAVNGAIGDGRRLRVKMGWAIPTGDTLKVWAYNYGSGPMTTGTRVSVSGKMYLRYI